MKIVSKKKAPRKREKIACPTCAMTVRREISGVKVRECFCGKRRGRG